MAMSSKTTSVNNSFGDTFMIETMQFLPTDLIFEQQRSTVLPVGNFKPLTWLDINIYNVVSRGTDQLSVSGIFTP